MLCYSNETDKNKDTYINRAGAPAQGGRVGKRLPWKKSLAVV